MKKTVLLIILGVLTVGCIIFGTVKHVGGGFRNLKNSGFFFDWDDEDEYDSDYTGKLEISENLKSFSSIKMDVHVMEIIIEEGSDFKIESSFNKERIKPVYSVEGGVLEIKQANTRVKGFSNGNFRCRVVITVPKGSSLKNITIDSNVGDIKLRDLEADKIDLTVNVGEIDVRKVDFEDLSCDTNVGEIEVNLNDSVENYNISAATDVGQVEVDGHSYKRSYNSRGSGSKNITLSGNVGEINIR